MILYKCDRCGEVHESKGEMTDILISHAGDSTVNYPRDGKFQVCKKCEIKLLNTLNALAGKENDMHKDDKVAAMEHLYFYQTGLSTLQSLQQKQMDNLIMSIRTPEIPAPMPAFGAPTSDCSYNEAFMDGYMAAVDYFIKNELDRIEPKEK